MANLTYLKASDWDDAWELGYQRWVHEMKTGTAQAQFDARRSLQKLERARAAWDRTQARASKPRARSSASAAHPSLFGGPLGG